MMLDVKINTPKFGGKTYGNRNRAYRAIWTMVWIFFGTWTPRSFVAWRRWLLCLFGAKIHPTAMVNRGVSIWSPKNLTMDAHSCLGPNVICYNLAKIHLKKNSLVSQGSHLCTGSHNISDINFQLIFAPIEICEDAWIAAEAFVGPGVSIGEKAILGARGVTFKSLDPNGIYIGNPAKFIKTRIIDRT